MALKDTIKHMRELLSRIETDLVKAEGGNKAASQRVRTGTVSLEKLAKVYRKESIHSEKGMTTTTHATRVKSSKKPAVAAKAKPKPKAKSASASSRPLQVKRPTAKLPKQGHGHHGHGHHR